MSISQNINGDQSIKTVTRQLQEPKVPNNPTNYQNLKFSKYKFCKNVLYLSLVQTFKCRVTSNTVPVSPTMVTSAFASYPKSNDKLNIRIALQSSDNKSTWPTFFWVRVTKPMFRKLGYLLICNLFWKIYLIIYVRCLHSIHLSFANNKPLDHK